MLRKDIASDSEDILSALKEIILAYDHKKDVNQLKKNDIGNDLLLEISYELPEIFKYKFDPNKMFILDKVMDIKKFELPFPDFSKATPFNCDPFLKFICPGCVDDEKRCKYCGATLFSSEYVETCCKNNLNIKKTFNSRFSVKIIH